MKRNDTIVAEVLKLLSNLEDDSITAAKICQGMAQGDQHQAKVIRHHIDLMVDRGFVEIAPGGHVRLTWEGHTAAEGESQFDE